MMDVDLPPVRRFRVVDKDDNILLITSGIITASFYQHQYNKIDPPTGYRINDTCISGKDLFIEEKG
tara:strand:+ start:497 stop:694 length:198 start_codon:yes stop_codon:yes gene_type:complete